MSCGAINDNLYRGTLLLAVAANGTWSGQLGEGGSGWVTAMLYAPFLLLLGFTGVLADRYPKRQIIVGSRVVELVLAVGVIGAMALQSLPLACILLVLLAGQSAFFSPAKYGSVPELVPSRQLSQANGLLSLLTNVSIVAGIGIAGFLLDVGPRLGMSGLIFVGLVMTVVATISVVISLFIPRHPPGQPDLPVTLNVFRPYWKTLRTMAGTDLAAATVAWCLFYSVASMIIVIIPSYGELLEISKTKVSLLMGVTGLGIAVGGVIAGFGSGQRIRAEFVPLGAIGLILSFLSLGLLSLGFTGVMILLGLTGMFAGIYLIPILAMLQHLPVPGFRARCVGTANFLTYVTMTASAIFYAVMSRWVGNEPPTWFLISAAMMTIILVWVLILLPRLRNGGRPEAFATIEDWKTA
ncbi:MAG: MFS transporter [Phycisphaerales bacterium]|nr:MFS transporter [Phycisphaerales bacterium]